MKTMSEIREEHRLRMAEFKRQRKDREKKEQIELDAARYKAHQQRTIKLQNEAEEVRKEIEKTYSIIDSHIRTLGRKKLQLTREDDYGIIDRTNWDRELEYFISTILLPQIRSDIHRIINSKWFISQIDSAASYISSQLYDAEELTPEEFEHYCADQIRTMGWEARVTKQGGDQGVDIVATKGEQVIAIQCKLWKSAVGNTAVQEVVAGMRFVGASKAVVVSNSIFTQQAKQLARLNRVLLIHHDDLSLLDQLLIKGTDFQSDN